MNTETLKAPSNLPPSGEAYNVAQSQNTTEDSQQATATASLPHRGEVGGGLEVEGGRRHPLRLILGIAVVILLFALVFTCPDRDAHKKVIVSQVNAALSESIDRMADNAGYGDYSLLGSMLASKVIDAAIDSRLEVSNYFVFSVSRITLGGKTHTLSYGLLGHVFTFDKTDITEELKKL